MDGPASPLDPPRNTSPGRNRDPHDSPLCVQPAAEFGHADVTPELAKLPKAVRLETVCSAVQMLGSTRAITTIEYEPGVLSDLRRALDPLAPVEGEYAHNARWGDGNGFSHVRSALLKASLSVPVVDGELVLGTWQQVVAISLDNRARQRELVMVIVGSGG